MRRVIWLTLVGVVGAWLLVAGPTLAQAPVPVELDRVIVIADGTRRTTIIRVRAVQAFDTFTLFRLAPDVAVAPIASERLIAALDADAQPEVVPREVLIWSSPTPTTAPQPTRRGSVEATDGAVQLRSMVADETLSLLIGETEGTAVLPAGLDGAALARATIDILAPTQVGAQGFELRYAGPLSADAAALLPAPAAVTLQHTRLRMNPDEQPGVLTEDTTTGAFRAQDVEPVFVDGRRSYTRVTIAVLVAAVASSLAFAVAIGFRRRIDRIGGEKN